MSLTHSAGYFFDVIRSLVERELRIRYKGSLLGLLWAILSPLGTVLILHVLFSRILPLNIPHYAAFLYSGLLPWTWFQSAMMTAAATLIDNRDLVRKPFFPRRLLPAVVTTTNFLLYLLALPVLIGLLLLEGVTLSPLLLLLPVVWMVQVIFTLACAMFVATVGVVIRDVQHLLSVILLLWFYLTPIFYDIQRIGLEQAQWLRFNPVTVIVEAHRALILFGRMPDWLSLGALTLIGGTLLALSLALFRGLEDTFVEEV